MASATQTPDAFLIPFDLNNESSAAPFQTAKLWSSGRPKNKADEAKLFYDVDQKGGLAAIVSVGSSKDDRVKREAVRRAAGIGARKLRESGAKVIGVDPTLDAHAAAVGSILGSYKFTLKTGEADVAAPPTLVSLGKEESASSDLNWRTGTVYAEAQNFARELMELPANMMTPTIFCERVEKQLKGLENIEIHARSAEWAKEKKMNSFLSVTHGTDEPAKFLEIHYHGASDKNAAPLAFVGKGITFDSGGISLKPSADMKLMRGDMGGAATVVSAAYAIAKLRLPVNLVVVTPLTENMPGPSASKPGDVVYAMNGKTIEIDNTDAEGRLVLADALTYVSREFKPHTLLDAATLTGAMVIAVGELYSGVFTDSDSLWTELHAAGEAEHDRFWRMPLDDEYTFQIARSNADLCNSGGRPAGSCTAALFLKAFVDFEANKGSEPIRWAHLDIAGAMESTRETPYQPKGMTGRPVRALVEFTRRLSQQKK